MVRMTRGRDLLLTAIAPAIWGSTYIVTTELLPPERPLTVSLLRALPAGLVLLLLVRQLPSGIWWARTAVLGALNFSIFWALLFVSAYRLPGGVAATIGAVQPLLVVVLEALVTGAAVRRTAVLVAVLGMAGVALLVLTPKAGLDAVGVAAGLGAALSMACGTVLTRHWRPPVTPLTVTAWQLAMGGLLLLPPAFLLEPSLPALTGANVLGFVHLGVLGAAVSYLLWFRGLARIEPSVIAPLSFLSPVTAVALGWGILGQGLSPVQAAGAAMVLGSVWLNQWSATRPSHGGER